MKRASEECQSTPKHSKRVTPSCTRIAPYLKKKRDQLNGTFTEHQIAAILTDILNDDEDLDKLKDETIKELDDFFTEQLADMSEFNLSQIGRSTLGASKRQQINLRSSNHSLLRDFSVQFQTITMVCRKWSNDF
jgi:hypothetical protein